MGPSKRLKALRFAFIPLAGRVLDPARQLAIRLCGRPPSTGLLLAARQRIVAQALRTAGIDREHRTPCRPGGRFRFEVSIAPIYPSDGVIGALQEIRVVFIAEVTDRAAGWLQKVPPVSPNP
jgi:hypothetical protein